MSENWILNILIYLILFYQLHFSDAIDPEDKCESMPPPQVITTQHSASSSRIGGTTDSLAVPDGAKRRSSMPTESLLIVGRGSNGTSNKSGRNRKKVLRRRSSGGADILNPVLTEEATFSAWTSEQPQRPAEAEEGGAPKTEMKHSLSWFRLKREGSVRRAADKEVLLSRRRGSLPIEVLAVGHSGE